MSKTGDFKGIIKQVKPDQVHVLISGGKGITNSFSVRPGQITFRNSQAPVNLISPDTKIVARFENSQLKNIWIDQDLDIQAYFGKIEEIDSESKAIRVSTSLISYNLSYSQLGHIENQPLVQDHIPSFINYPVLIYFNSESPIEARILHSNWKRAYKLDTFSKNFKNEEESEFFVLKDTRLIPHKLSKDSVYDQGLNKTFRADIVKYNIGAEVEVFVNNQQVWGAVKTRSNFAHKKQNSSSLNLDSENHLPTEINYPSHRTELVVMLNHSKIHKKPSQVFGKRIALSKSPVAFYYKENNYFKDIGIVLLGLLEVCHRFPSYETLRNKLYIQLRDSILNLENPKFRNDLDQLFSIFRKPNQLSNLEDFYKIVSEQSGLFEYYASFFIGNQYSFDFISDFFEVCIYFCDSSGNWVTYLPIFNHSNIPVIYLRQQSKLELLYKEETMMFDGYDLNTLEYTVPNDFDVKILLHSSQKTPNFSSVFSSILNLTNTLSNKIVKEESEVNKSIKSIAYSLNQLSELIPQDQMLDCKNAYEKLLRFNIDKNIIQSCKCGKEINERYTCADHSLCQDCAFLSNRLGKCVVCQQAFNQTVVYKDITCSHCGQSYQEKYFSAFSCYCILCTRCIYTILSENRGYCYKNHQLQQFDYDNSYSYFKKVGN